MNVVVNYMRNIKNRKRQVVHFEKELPSFEVPKKKKDINLKLFIEEKSETSFSPQSELLNLAPAGGIE